MFAAGRGEPLNWSDVMAAVAWADVIFVGEQHDDALGHVLELAVVQDTLKRWPHSALSMEMLERDEQHLVDDFLDDVIDQPTFAKLTGSESWAGKDSWKDWYQPMIDVAKQRHSDVVAANAPRRYVRLARTDGYNRLRKLPANRRRFFDLPLGAASDSYRKRFAEAMTGTPPTTATTKPDAAAATSPATQPAKPAGHGDGTPPTCEQLDAGLRSQRLWDATMAGSIANARADGAKKVVHIVGQFHCEFEGGTVQELRRRRPHDRILVISMQRENALDENRMRDEDRHRADIVIYTGARPDEESSEATSKPSG